jgi:hypothetical protein
MMKLEVPPRGGLAVRVEEGQSVRVITPKGAQAADFFAYCAADLREWLSPMHTWVTTRSIKPRPGDIFLSRFRRPMLEFLEDTAGGMHDMMLAACDQTRYEQYGFVGPHASCSDNLRNAMARLGHPIDVVPQPVNFFTNTKVEPDGKLVSPPNTVPAGPRRSAGAHGPDLRRLVLPVRPAPARLDDQRRERADRVGGGGEVKGHHRDTARPSRNQKR